MTEKLIDRILLDAVEQDASDITIKPGSYVFYRIGGKPMPIVSMKISQPQVEMMVDEIVGQRGAKSRLTESDLNYSYEVKVRGEGYDYKAIYRFRVNIARSGEMPGLFIRRLKAVTAKPEDLGIPSRFIDSVSKVPYGLFLVTGPTGMGKSTTLACILSHLMGRESMIVVTAEDPKEYELVPGVSLPFQREVGTDVSGFAEAIKSAMREKPDILLVGEIRDPETAVAAAQIAKSGHKVFSTLHTEKATASMSRIVGMFPGDRENWIRTELTDILVGVTVQALVPKADGGLLLCTEFLDLSQSVHREMLGAVPSKTRELRDLMMSGEIGWTMNQDMLAKMDEGKISSKAVRKMTNELDELKSLRPGLFSD